MTQLLSSFGLSDCIFPMTAREDAECVPSLVFCNYAAVGTIAEAV